MQALTCCHNNNNKKGGADCSVLISFRRITYGNRRIYGIVWLNVPNENRLTPLTEIFETEFESRPIPAGLKSKIISITRTSNRVLQPNNAVTDKFTKL